MIGRIWQLSSLVVPCSCGIPISLEVVICLHDGEFFFFFFLVLVHSSIAPPVFFSSDGQGGTNCRHAFYTPTPVFFKLIIDPTLIRVIIIMTNCVCFDSSKSVTIKVNLLGSFLEPSSNC